MDEEAEPVISHKRHKKHKKKHKRRHNDEGNPLHDDSPKPAIRLKIKIGPETFGEKRSYSGSVTKTEISGNCSDLSEEESDVDVPEAEVVVADDPDSDDEQAWMAALEAGELDESGALKTKKGKEKKTLTKRQKALAESKTKDASDIIYAWYPVLSPDELQRRQQRAEKRRVMAREKREKDKKSTLDRLLRKQEAKVRHTKARRAKHRKNVPRVHYVQTQTAVTLSYPENMDVPIPTLTSPAIPKPVLCAVDGCQNPKKYSCSKTHRPVCSLECYKKNLATVIVPVSVAV